MARIRTVKPEFWSDEQVMECSPLARLLFIGIWNFCDDAGNHPLSDRTIKALIFPGDDIDSTNIRRLLDELSSNALIRFYECSGKQYLNVSGWRHQKIDKPTIKHPGFPGDGELLNDGMRPACHFVAEDSSNTSRAFGEASPTEGKGKGRGEEQDQKQRATPKPKKAKSTEEEAILPDWLPKQEWADYVQMRKEKKKPVNPSIAGRVIKKLDAMRMAGHNIQAALENSIVNCWTDIYEPKVDFNGTGTNTERSRPLSAVERVAAKAAERECQRQRVVEEPDGFLEGEYSRAN